MLRTCNKHVASVGSSWGTLTVNIEIARLHSAFAACRSSVRWGFLTARAEGAGPIKAIFWDTWRQLRGRTVSKRRQSGYRAALLAAAFLSGCASVGGISADTPEQAKRDAVAARAEARWQALIKGDLPAAYEYLSPASRATVPLDVYKAKHKVGLYRSAKVESVDCVKDACTVRVNVVYDYKRFKGVATPLVEKWIIAQGQAWLVEGS